MSSLSVFNIKYFLIGIKLVHVPVNRTFSLLAASNSASRVSTIPSSDKQSADFSRVHNNNNNNNT